MAFCVTLILEADACLPPITAFYTVPGTRNPGLALLNGKATRFLF